MPYKKIILNEIGCHRGKLIVFENGCNLPFVPKRTYVIYGNNPNIRRGNHAHKNLKQLAVCISGSCHFLLHDGQREVRIELTHPQQGLLIEGLMWREMYDFSPNCVLMVVADKPYDEKDYIRDFHEFLNLVKENSVEPIAL